MFSQQPKPKQNQKSALQHGGPQMWLAVMFSSTNSPPPMGNFEPSGRLLECEFGETNCTNIDPNSVPGHGPSDARNNESREDKQVPVTWTKPHYSFLGYVPINSSNSKCPTGNCENGPPVRHWAEFIAISRTQGVEIVVPVGYFPMCANPSAFPVSLYVSAHARFVFSAAMCCFMQSGPIRCLLTNYSDKPGIETRKSSTGNAALYYCHYY